jgi:hypothetical protein
MPEEALMLQEMTPHARKHAMHLLAVFPGLTLTSTRRTPERNRAVGGVPGSYHLSGRAADFGGRFDVLERAREYALRDRVSRGCTGPEECFIEGTGRQRVGGSSTGLHLHCAW